MARLGQYCCKLKGVGKFPLKPSCVIMLHKIIIALYTCLRRNMVLICRHSRTCTYSVAQAVLSAPILINADGLGTRLAGI